MISSQIVIVKPFNCKGQLDLIMENISIDELYIKKQVYELIFHDVDVFFETIQSINIKRTHYKLKPKRPLVKTCEIRIKDLIIPIQIDFSLLV